MIDLKVERWRDMQRRVWNASPCRVVYDAPPWRGGCARAVWFQADTMERSVRTLFLYERDERLFASMGDMTLEIEPSQWARLAAMSQDRTRFPPHKF